MFELNRKTLIKFTTGKDITMRCRVCNRFEIIPEDTARNKRAQKNKQIVNFNELHFGLHMKETEEKQKQEQYDKQEALIVNTLEIDTRRISPKQFCFYVTERNRIIRIEDHIHTYQEDEDDFIKAVIVNLGKACRLFADAGMMNGTIVLEQEPKDRSKYERHHVVVYHLLFPESNAESRKNASLFSAYQRYLGRIRELMRYWKITIKLSELPPEPPPHVLLNPDFKWDELEDRYA